MIAAGSYVVFQHQSGRYPYIAALLPALERLQTLCRPVGQAVANVSLGRATLALMDNNLLDDWFTKSQAAAFLQVSEKTIERLARKGEIRRETRKRPGVRPSPVYSPEDLDRVKAAQVPQVVVMPPQAEAGGVPALAPRLDLPSFLQSLVTGADVPLRDKLFLTVKEAVRFSGLPESTIRRLLRSGKLPGFKAGGWRIRRVDLEELGCRQLKDLSDTLSLTSL